MEIRKHTKIVELCQPHLFHTDLCIQHIFFVHFFSSRVCLLQYILHSLRADSRDTMAMTTIVHSAHFTHIPLSIVCFLHCFVGSYMHPRLCNEWLYPFGRPFFPLRCCCYFTALTFFCTITYLYEYIMRISHRLDHLTRNSMKMWHKTNSSRESIYTFCRVALFSSWFEYYFSTFAIVHRIQYICNKKEK